MKRLLAALLTLSMLVGIVPFSAFAESPGAVPETFAAAQESPGLDDETVQSIVSDPLLQGQYAPPQQTQPTVDTSNMSMEATDSFGKLLVNSIDEQNSASSSENRVIGVTVDGSTATVEYVAAEDADLVVGIYTDNSAKEMVASGTTSVLATVETSSSSFATVNISGTIPEYYTVKCYLLDKTEHAPLSPVYSDNSNTQGIIDIKNATVNDFDPERVINLDSDNSTNFAVVNPGVTLITYDDAPAGKNLLVENDSDGLNYIIDNATDEIKNLHSGSIFTYEYEEGSLLVTLIKKISVSGDTVTIHGDDSLTLEDVFAALKVETDAGSDEIQYTAPAEDGVEYLGTTSGDFSDFDFSLDEENSFEASGEFKVAHEFKIFKVAGESSSDHLTGEGSISGTLKVSASEELKFYVGGGKTSLTINLEAGATGSLSADGSVEAFIELGSFGFSPVAGVYVGFIPRLVYKTSITGKASFSITFPVGISYTNTDGLQNTSDKPVCKLNASVEGSIYIGLDFKPTVKILESVVNVSLTTEAGVTGTVKMNVSGKEFLDQEDSHHLCKKCFSLSIKGSLNLNVEVSFLKLSDLTFTLNGIKLETPEKKAYWAPEYHDFGWDDCPHNAYRIVARVMTDEDIIGKEVKSYQDNKWSKIGEVTEKYDDYSEAVLYLTPGDYRLRVVVGTDTYESAVFTVDDSPSTETLLKVWVPDPDPDTPAPDNPAYTIEDGRLTIYNENIMLDYASASDTPWYNSRDEITYILTQYMVKKISSYAFADCDKVTTVQIGDEITKIGDYAFSGCTFLEKVVFAGTMAKWKEVQIGIGNDILNNIEIICTDGSINTKDENLIIASGECGSNGANVIWILNKSGNLEISGTGSMKDYSNNTTAPWYKRKGDIESVTINRGVINVGSFAFFECYAIKDVSIANTVTSIDSAAFLGCSEISNINLPDSITTIGNAAFAGCESLSCFIVPSLVTHIEDFVFEECKALKSIVIPDSVTRIGKHTFQGCWSLTNVQIPASVIIIDENAFEGCSGIEKFTIPDGVTNIGSSAFLNCKKLTSVTLPSTVSEIGNSIFSGCGNLIEINFPSNLTEIGNDWFNSCYSLTNIELPNNIISIGIDSFTHSGLVNIVLPEKVGNVNQSAFENCDKLTRVKINAVNPTIGYAAFRNCSNLKDVDYIGTKAQWASLTILDKNNSLLSATIHCTDGDILPTSTVSSEENSIFSSTATGDDHSFAASFSDLTPGVSYAVIVSRSEIDPLAPENLIYINQFRATSSGYQQSFQTPRSSALNADDMTYVIASGIYSFDEAPTPTPTPTPGGGSSSGGGGGGGGGAAVLIGVGAAAAITAGVIMMSPVDVKGRVVLADQAAVPGAKISLLREGKVVAQTTADENGSFSLKAKRGSYELTAAYTTADGQLIYKTIDIKAPAKDLTVTF